MILKTQKFKKRIAFVLVLMIVLSGFAANFNAATINESAIGAAGITVHYYCEGGAPTIYYWNALPTNLETAYPGKAMQAEGENWYKYTFASSTKINMLFVKNGVQSAELTRNTGEWWYKNNRWTAAKPGTVAAVERTDMREDSIYFIMTTRFYDGDTGNNVHCWDDSKAGNPDSDPAWRGDFKGLIDKLDYIKALGFSAIWVTPVVTNASGYDYHGYHAMDFSTVDVRYESSGATYQDLIDAVHEKGMKIVQDVVWNHTGNFGESFLAPMFKKVYNNVEDLGSITSMEYADDSKLKAAYPNYDSMNDDQQYGARLAIMKNTDGKNHDTNNYYHHTGALSWQGYDIQTGQIHGDCVDINTENQAVADYLNDSYMNYVNMGVDGFRLDTAKHLSRWTLNSAYFPLYTAVENFFLFGEVCARYRDVWNEGVQAISCPFYTWKESGNWTSNWSKTNWQANLDNASSHFAQYTSPSSPKTSDNAFLNGNEYHTPDHSQSNGTSTIDFLMHWSFRNASDAFHSGLSEDRYFNNSTYLVTYVDSHDYGPDGQEKTRFAGGTQAWAENLNLIFTFRGIPCIYYGSEVEFKKDVPIDVGPNSPLEQTGRAYFGDYLEGNVTATDFAQYTASGTVANTLNAPLAKHLQKLNLIRRAVPALQKGQYSVQNVTGNMAFKRGYTDPQTGKKSFVCVAISDGASFSGIPNGTYIDAVTGASQNVSGGSLSIASPGQGNMRVFVLSSNGYSGISGKIGDTGTYLK
ncbi:MAG: starch-binding protein [Oscillospiraceae bacterium]|nr:starch-binding protein [Oscillospiraceae bacterium]